MRLSGWIPVEIDGEEPLLTSMCGAPLAPGPERLGEQAARWLWQRYSACQEWWAITTCSDFLSSSASRRDTWLLGWVSMTSVSGLYDQVSGRGHTWWNMAIFFLSLLMGQLPRRTLLSDVAVVVFWTLCEISLCMFCDDPDYFDSVGEVTMMAALGCHSSSLAFFVVLNTPLAVVFGFADEAAMLFVIGMLIAAGHAYIEYRAALLFDQVKKNLISTRHLLDSAGDGFCNIDTSSGVITNASPKLQRTFADWPALQGQRFQHLLAAQDVGRFEALFSEARTDSEQGPILVTCLLNQTAVGMDAEAGTCASFDAKLIPHKSYEGDFSICIQVIGEMRLHQPTRPAADALTGPTPAPAAAASPTAVEGEGAAAAAEPHGPEAEAPLSEEGSGSEFGTFTFDISQTQGSEWCGRSSRRGGQALQTADTASQTEATQGRPPRPPGIGAELGRQLAQRALPVHRRRSSVKAHLNSSQRILPQFRPTPRETLRFALVESMAHINGCGVGCCNWHILWTFVRQEAKHACQGACQPAFKPHEDFQCTHCGAMNEYNDSDSEGGSGSESDETQEIMCQVCLKASGQRRRAPPSSSAAADDEAMQERDK